MIGLEGILDRSRIEANTGYERKLKNTLDKSSFEKRLKGELEKEPSNRKKVEEKRLMDACVEMESLFVGRMFKEMRKNVHKGEWLHGGFAEEIFEDMLYDQYSLNVSKNTNMGIAKMLYEEMRKKL